MNAQGDAIRLRMYPYPYRGALSICNDLDGTSHHDFLEIHRFLNTTLNTTLGPGLGLEIGDSFWMFRAEPGREPTYFLEASTKPSPFAPLLRDLIQMGYVDCLHTFGDFNRVGGFRRELAMAAFEELERQQLKLRVWTDHGDIHNFQNLATPWSMGDLPFRASADGARTPTAEYHADLTLAYGIRFIWTGLTPFPGQDRPLDPGERMAALRDPGRLRAVIRRLRRRQIKAGECSGLWENRLFTVGPLRDGQSVYGFRRFGRFGRDHEDSLSWTLSPEVLQRLKDRGGCAIVFVHWGKRDPSQMAIFSKGTLARLRGLAEEYRHGEIYVTTTARLLTHISTRKSLRWTVRHKEGRWDIRIDSIRDPVGGERLPTVQELQGLTFYCREPERTRIVMSDEEIKAVANPPDETGRRSLSIPLFPLPSDELGSLLEGTSTR